MSQARGDDQAAAGAGYADAHGAAPPPQGAAGPWQPRPAPYDVAPTNGLAIAALVVAFVFAPAGLVMGILAKGQIARSGEQGDGLATAAIVVSAVFIGLTVLAFVGFFVLFAAVAGSVHVGTHGGFPGNSLRLVVRA